jgi:hypothetical protein
MCYPGKLCNNENCVVCEDASFASVILTSISWSPNNKEKEIDKDGNEYVIIPRRITKGSNKLFLFVCNNEKCKHEFLASPKKVKNGKKCPFPDCNTSPKELCGDYGCLKCFHSSFESSDKVDLWSNVNEEMPRHVFGGYFRNIFICM